MTSFLEFVFSSFWYFLGTVILIAVFFEGLEDVVKAFNNRKK